MPSQVEQPGWASQPARGAGRGVRGREAL